MYDLLRSELRLQPGGQPQGTNESRTSNADDFQPEGKIAKKRIGGCGAGYHAVMIEPIAHDGDVIVRQERALRRITLNRPKALNALTLDMAVTMTALLRSWATDPEVGAVLIDGAGERGLCAGGDIRALYDAAKAGTPLPAQFWATEYHLNVLIARYPKPVIAVMDGMVMGGGVGLSAHAAYRVVTERSAVAMPEVGIGFFPTSARLSYWRERRDMPGPIWR